MTQNPRFSIERGLFYFSSKVFSRSYPHFGKVKNQEKKTLAKKVVGSPWIHP
jgi:hypothetical protein